MKYSIKYHINQLLFHPTGIASRILDAIIAFLIIFSAATIPFYIIPYFNYMEQELWIFEMTIVCFFSIEYILRIWVSDKNSRYCISFDGFIDLVAILPFILEELHIIPHEFGFLVFIRILRILRIIKLVKMYNLEREIIAKNAEDEHGTFNTMRGEKIKQIVHKHSFVFLFSLFSVIFFTFLGLLVFAIFPLNMISLSFGITLFSLAGISFMKNWLNFHYDAIYITNYRVIVQDRHIFGMNRNEIPYRAITHVHPNTKGFLKFIFTYGGIEIETAGKSVSTKFPYIPNVEQVVRVITRKIEESRHATPYSEPENKQSTEKKEYIPLAREVHEYNEVFIRPHIFKQSLFEGLRQKLNISIYKLLHPH